ncbi:hypothetical protein RB1553 [Rhodopirellula baltica SH 1]|uniref:Uncharacterized protein n=1 Tax=Rhodopirellula baltica (strain DSM 10527 / NCIMB 13988 / SH1) TaxID=243090 RepID=Q7UX56_RHOBA|nr:hypothetical protein RB1553 [Rhodopirellula baltica SH 1]
MVQSEASNHSTTLNAAHQPPSQVQPGLHTTHPGSTHFKRVDAGKTCGVPVFPGDAIAFADST